MPQSWRATPLEKLLTRSEDWIALDPERSYREITVKLWGKGVILRRETFGSEIASPRRLRVRSRQFILSRIDARNGAMGLVPDSLDAGVVSNDFPAFQVNIDEMLPEYLGWMCRTGWFVELCKSASEGTTNRVRLQEDRFLKLQIPLPPLPEQRRIVGRIEGAAGRIVGAHALRKQAAEEATAIQSCVVSSILDDPRWENHSLASILAEFPRNGLSPKAEVASGGRRMLRISAVSSSPTRFVDLSAYKMVDVVDEEAKPFVLCNDDVFIVRYNGDINRVAKAAIFKGQADAVFPDKLMRLRTRSEQMTPDFLVYALSSQRVRKQIAGMGKTTAGQVGISGTDANKFIVPVPPLPDQHRIVAKLDDLQAKMDTLKRLISESSAELDALLPSVLDRAFKGEL